MNKEIKVERVNKSIYVENGLVYKVFKEGFNKADVLNEALNLARVEQTGLRIPTLVEVKVIDGNWALVTKNIEGKTMEELLEENPSEEDDLLERFVDVQIHIQSMRCPLLQKHRDKMNRKVCLTELSSTLRYDLHNRIEAMPKYNCLCHGDYNPTNVIISSKDGLAYIVDWAHATQGNAEADAARTYMMFLVENKKERAKKYIDIFTRKSGCDRMTILEWLPILAASQSVKGISEETEFLNKLIFMDKKGLKNLYEQ